MKYSPLLVKWQINIKSELPIGGFRVERNALDNEEINLDYRSPDHSINIIGSVPKKEYGDLIIIIYSLPLK
jgi:hypothetical protein